MYPGLPLITPRLEISDLAPADLEPFAAMHADAEVMRYLGDGQVWTRAHAEMILPNIIGNTRGHPLDFVAVRKRDTREFMGMVCLLNLPAPHREAIGGGPYVEIGWRFARAFWNQGYATEAAAAVRDYAFDKLRLAEIVCIVDARNGASLRVAETIGLTFVKTYPFNGREIVFHALARP